MDGDREHIGNGENEPCLWRSKMYTEGEMRKRKRIYWLDFFVAAFGVGAWVGVNGLYVQMPLIVKTAPESWSLPNRMAVVIQIANIGPLAYSFLRKIVPQVRDSFYIFFVLILGTLAMILSSFLYDVTTTINGAETSSVLLILIFFIALVGCTSSVLFYPFMRHYREIYLVSYLIGEGLSGFLPSILALIQGVGGNGECVVKNNTVIHIEPEPRFGVTPFILCLSVLMLLSLLSFTCLIFTKKFDSEKVKEVENKDKDDSNTYQNISIYTKRNVTLLCLMATVCALGNGVYPSVQSYSSLPYGNTAYHLAVTLSSMANPVACFMAVFLPKTSNGVLATLSTLCAAISSYIIATALLSPVPPLQGRRIGEVLVVLSWIAAVALVSYIKLCVATVFRGLGARAMFVCGAVSQAGSAVGSLILFLLISYTTLFTSNDPCL